MQAAHIFYVQIRDLILRVVCDAPAALWPCNVDFPQQLIFRAGVVGRISGFFPYIYGHMDITGLGWLGSQGKVLCLYHAASGIMITYAFDGQFS